MELRAIRAIFSKYYLGTILLDYSRTNLTSLFLAYLSSQMGVIAYFVPS